MSSTVTNNLGTEPIGRLLFRLSLPAITAQLINALYNIIDRMYIGHMEEVGGLALTGVGVTFPILIIVAAFSMLIGMGGAPRAAIKMGRKDQKGAEEILGNCAISLVVISLFLTAFFLLFQRPVLLAFGASEQTLPFAQDYLTIYVSGTLFVQISLGLNSFINTQGFAKIGMMTVLIGAVLNIVLDPLFIYAFELGVRGAALATVVSQGISALWVLRFLTGKRTSLRIRIKYFKVKKTVLLPVLALGVSPFIMTSTDSLVTIMLNSALQRHGGDLAVGAMTICGSVMQVMMMPVSGLNQGGQPIISYNYGAKKMDRVKKTFRLLFILSVALSVLAWAVCMLLPRLLVQIFNKDPEILSQSVWALRIYTAAMFILGVQWACQQAFVAIGEAKTSLFLAMLRKIILLIPFILIFPYFFADKVFAVFFAEPVADVLASVTTGLVFLVRFQKILRKKETG